MFHTHTHTRNHNIKKIFVNKKKSHLIIWTHIVCEQHYSLKMMVVVVRRTDEICFCGYGVAVGRVCSGDVCVCLYACGGQHGALTLRPSEILYFKNRVNVFLLKISFGSLFFVKENLDIFYLHSFSIKSLWFFFFLNKKHKH